MDLEILRDYCLKKNGVFDCLPFNDEVLVFKVISKMFLLANLTPPHRITIKCEPENAIDMRERYPAVKPAYHMNKQHWNSVELNDTIPDALLKEWIDDSYDLVASGLKRSDKEKLSKL